MPPKSSYKDRKDWGSTGTRRSRAKVYRIGGKNVPAPLLLVNPGLRNLTHPKPITTKPYAETTEWADLQSYEHVDMTPTNSSTPKPNQQAPNNGDAKIKRNDDWHKAQADLLTPLRQYIYRSTTTCNTGGCNRMATIWCLMCSDLGPMCAECANSLHSSNESRTHICRVARPQGKALIWETIPEPPWGNEIVFNCTASGHHSTSRWIRFMQPEGQQHMKLTYCTCRTLNNVLISIGYWPSSPKRCQR